ncbi:MAG: Ig-like domain-containing protein [Opitutaceae bacterium]
MLATSSWSADLTLSWTDNSDNETGFKIERSLNGSSFSQVATVGANVESYTDAGLTAGTQYWFRVRATNASGDSGYTNVASATTAGSSPVNTAPTISNITNQTIAEDGTTGSLAFVIGDGESAASGLSLSASSSNAGLIPVSAVVFGGSGANRTVTVSPLSNQSGSATITVTVSDGLLSASDSFVVTVTAVNDAPLASDDGGYKTLPNQALSVTAALGVLANDSDVEGTILSAQLVAGVSHGNLTLNANGSFVYTPALDYSGNDSFTYRASDGVLTSNTATVSISIQPQPVGDSDALVHLLLDEGSGSVALDGSGNGRDATLAGGASYESDTGDGSAYAVHLDGVNGHINLGNLDVAGTGLTLAIGFKADSYPADRDPRLISKASSTAANDHIFMLSTTVSDSQNRLRGRLRIAGTTTTLIATSGNLTAGVWYHGAMTYDGTTLRLYLDGTEVGSTALSGIIATDSSMGVAAGSQPDGSQSFDGLIDDVRIYSKPLTQSEVQAISEGASPPPANTTPSISNITNKTIAEDTDTGAISFTVSDAQTSAGTLSVSGSSSNTSLVPNGNIVFGGSGGSRTVTVTPAADQSGTTTITVTVSDGSLSASDTFTLTVSSVNDAPAISNITNKTIAESTSTAAIAFTVSDLETAAGSLILSGSSSNISLVPNGNIVFGGSGGNRTVTVTPAAGQSGSSTITVTVSDGNLSASDTFTLTVTGVNDAPTISDISNKTTNEDTSTAAIAFTVSDPETVAGSLTVSGNSSNTSLVPNGNIVFAGSGGSRTVTITPAADQSGTTTITVTVSDGSLSASDTFTLVVAAVNDAPAISNITNKTIAESSDSGAIAFTVSDVETASSSLTVSGSSSNTSLVPNSNIAFGGSGANRTVTVTPAPGQSGVATITVSVSDGNLSASDSFTLTVTSVNDSPTISNITNKSISEDESTGATAFTISDPETAAGSLALSSTSSNTTLVPESGIVFGGSGGNRTVTVTPAADQFGSTTITVTVSDGNLSASDSFTLTVNAVNDAPTVTDISNRTIAENGNTGAIAFTVSDPETAAADLSVTGGSSNTTLVPNGNIVFGGSGANRSVTVTPVAGQSGTATITVAVSDGSLSSSDAFTLTVSGVNDGPLVSNIADVSIPEDGSTGPIAFTVSDAETGAADLTITGTSSNTSLVPNGNIVLGGNGGNRTVTVTPVANQSGTATVTIAVSDGSLTGSDTFELTVSPVNDAPTISNISNKTVAEDSPTSAIAFTVSDLETSAGSLTVSGSSSNPSLVLNSAIVFSGSGGNRALVVTPAAGQSGTATITVTVSDGNLSASDSFVLTVTGVNDAPTISNITNKTVNEDTATAAIGFTISDAETAAGSLTVSGSSSNTTLVPNEAIVFGGSNGNRTVTVSPAANQSGTANITVTVNDGSLSASDTFTLTVTAVNDVPTISNITNRTIGEGATTGAIAFTVSDIETSNGSLTLSADSSNTTLVPVSGIVFGGSGGNRTVTVTPVAGQNGSATITVTVNDGSSSASDAFVLTVTASPDPVTVSVISPVEGATFTVGDTIAGEALTSDIARTATVEFFHDSTQINTERQSPYNFSWTPDTAGTYAIKAIVTDTDGAKTESAPISITIADPTPDPLTVSLTSPADGTDFAYGSTINVSATVSDTARTNRVELLIDGSVIGQDTTSPYVLLWSGGTSGDHTIQVRAVDNDGGSVLSEVVNVTVGSSVLTVTLTNPVGDRELEAGQALLLEAVPSDIGNTSKIEFLVDGSIVNTQLQTPYDYSWSSTDIGAHTVQAKAYDADGASTLSASVTITVTDPAGGAVAGVYRGTLSTTPTGAAQAEGSATPAADAALSGEFAVHVDAEGWMHFLGFESTSGLGFADGPIQVETDGFFTLPLAVPEALQSLFGGAAVVTIEGRITSKGIEGTIVGTDIVLTGSFSGSAGATENASGFYELFGTRSSDTRVLLIIGADGIGHVIRIRDGVLVGEVVDVSIDGVNAFLASVDLGLEIVIDTVSGSLEGLLISNGGEIASLMGLRSDVSPDRRLENISTRGTITSGSGVMISGFVVSGDAPKTVLIRAIGPGLGQFGITNYMTDPVLELVGEAGLITSNARWILGNFGSIVETVSARIGAFALDPDSLDAALLVTVAPGRYSAVVRDAAGRGGDSLIEIYDATDTVVTGNDLVNLSTRGAVGSGKNLIGGFVVTGNVPKRVLIRGIGPGLAQFGVANALSSARLVLTQRVDGVNERIGENTGWSTNPNAEAIQTASESAGAFLLESGSGDSALLIWLEPGIYTAEVQPGTTGASGTGLVEVYQTD